MDKGILSMTCRGVYTPQAHEERKGFIVSNSIKRLFSFLDSYIFFYLLLKRKSVCVKLKFSVASYREYVCCSFNVPCI